MTEEGAKNKDAKNNNNRNTNSLTPIRVDVNSDPINNEPLLSSSPTDRQPRRSFYYSSSATFSNPNRQKILDEIDKVERLITLTLQGVDEDLSKVNTIIVDKVLPTLEDFNQHSSKIFNNVSHIKEFFENAANVNILTKRDIELLKQQSNETELNEESNEAFESTIGTTDLSEFKNIKNRYKENFSDSLLKQNAETTVTQNMSARHGDASSSIYSETPSVIKRLLKRPIEIGSKEDEKDEVSTNNFSFLRGLKIHADDESTAKQPVQKISIEQYQRSLIDYNKNKLDNDTSTIGIPNKEINESRNKTQLSPHSERNKYVNDLIAQYDSPPWEEPPELESAKFLSPIRKKRKRSISGSGSRSRSRNRSRSRSRSRSASLPGSNSSIHENIEGGHETSDEESVRFPMSPKYGAGGKLLRSEKGRQIALNFARSELIANHPILSLQPQSKTNENEATNANVNVTTNTVDTFYSLDTSSTFEDPPQLMSELLLKREGLRKDERKEQRQASAEELSNKDTQKSEIPISATHIEAPYGDQIDLIE